MSVDIDGGKALLVRGADAETVGGAPITTWLLAEGDPTGGSVSAIRSKMARSTGGPPPHYHVGSAEIFFVIEGGLRVLAGEEVITAGEGDLLLVPPGMPHAFRTTEDSGVDMLVLKPTAERFEYFRLADRIRRGQASPAEILAKQDIFDNHFVDSSVWAEELR
ncbi:cupin domain-containing protein [Actinoallomurus sp. NBC_01490]|uniref:cupin domain-containing protein n=1 Tax=Actinoallomurus sp. NBC_01490 TaxID=2903557 RepID=UPI002E36B99A|nr:cupin domain-containing protein [Actinoallomurus sp. NBC_01490]